jgi:hypothetical protein
MRDRTGFAPLTPTRPAVPVPARYGWGGPGSLLALSSGSIASDLHAIGIDRKRKFATYELLVANETISPVAAFAYAVGAAANSMMSWSTITVPPFASIAVTLDVPLPRAGRKQRVVVELHAEDAHLTLDAEPPAAVRRLISPRTLLAGLAAAAAGLGIAAYGFAQPRILALAAPKTVTAGKPFNVAYVVTDASNANYLIETPQGFQVGSGTLDHRTGSIAVTLPNATDLHSYDLRISTRNRFGSDSRITRIAALPPPPSPPPAAVLPKNGRLLPDIALSAAEVTGGQPIGVSYVAGATADVLLIDQAGKVVGKALLDSTGKTVLDTPPVRVDQTFKVVVKAHEGNSTVESAASLVVKASRPDELPPLDQAGAPVPEAGIAVEGDLPFAVASPVVRGGELVRVAVVQHEEGLRIALTTVAGSEIGASDVAVNQDSVAIRAPKVTARTEFLIIATFRRGVSQETVVRPITVSP